MLEREEIETRAGFHTGTDNTIPRHNQLRRLLKQVLEEVNTVLPATGREAQLGIDAIETGFMWLHKSIAREDPVDNAEIKKDVEADIKDVRAEILRMKMLEDFRPYLGVTENEHSLFSRLYQNGYISPKDMQMMYPNESVDPNPTQTSHPERLETPSVIRGILNNFKHLRIVATLRDDSDHEFIYWLQRNKHISYELYYQAYPNRLGVSRERLQKFLRLKHEIILDGGYPDEVKSGDDKILGRAFVKHGRMTRQEFFDLFSEYPDNKTESNSINVKP